MFIQKSLIKEHSFRNSLYELPKYGFFITREYTIKLVDEPFGWTTGDTLVIASTDYDMHQAEMVELIGCESLTCTVSADLRYSHYGEIYKTVDMRGEVGLITRNIKIHGQMKDENDTYGGHIKAFQVHNDNKAIKTGIIVRL